MEPIMKLWGLLRVNDIHIGTNKKFTLLFHNTQNTKVFHGFYYTNCKQNLLAHISSYWFFEQLEGTIALDANIEHDEMDALQMKTIDILLEHKNDDTVLHRLSTAIVIQNVNEMHCSVKCNQMNVNFSVAHTDRNGQLWMVIYLVKILILFKTRKIAYKDGANFGVTAFSRVCFPCHFRYSHTIHHSMPFAIN